MLVGQRPRTAAILEDAKSKPAASHIVFVSGDRQHAVAVTALLCCEVLELETSTVIKSFLASSPSVRGCSLLELFTILPLTFDTLGARVVPQLKPFLESNSAKLSQLHDAIMQEQEAARNRQFYGAKLSSLAGFAV